MYVVCRMYLHDMNAFEKSTKVHYYNYYSIFLCFQPKNNKFQLISKKSDPNFLEQNLGHILLTSAD